MIHGYPEKPSVRPGDTLTLHVSTTARWFRADFYRQGARLTPIGSSGWWRGSAAPDGPPHEDWRWPAYRFRIPRDWRSGAYVAMLTEGDRRKTPVESPDTGSADARSMKALFVVVSKTPGVTAPILYKLPFTTYHAYNYAGGGSLYQNHRVSLIPFGSKVTVRRPGGGTGGPLPPSHHDFLDVYDSSSPRQSFAHWDAPFIGWLEANGYAVDYCTDLELHEHADHVRPYRLLLSAGHDEYWSEGMRAHAKAFIRAGGNAAFFGGNTCWWRIHFVDGNTAFVCDKFRNTDLWWAPSGANTPEDTLTGVSYRHGGGWWNGPRDAVGYTVHQPAHWVFEGTGLEHGSTFGAPEHLIGYECDGAALAFDDRGAPARAGGGSTPSTFAVLGTGTLSTSWQDRPPRECSGPHAATMGVHEDRGTVFAASTTDWTRVLALNQEAHVDRITKNVLDRLSR
ncbi:MAG TPA: N,N-dimethylformamidase beta subunit family domain-containing protein [bacterium]|nr:N,N-dimethylformamidase beta subunit family domain-containing protein [bacterium]